MHKQLVAGLSGLVTCLQSNSIGTNFHGLLFKLRHLWAFPLSLCSLLGACWLAGSRQPDGGRESHHFRGNRNPGPGHLPAQAAPHYLVDSDQRPSFYLYYFPVPISVTHNWIPSSICPCMFATLKRLLWRVASVFSLSVTKSSITT